MNTIDIAIAVIAAALVIYSVHRLLTKKTCDCDQCPSTCQNGCCSEQEK